MFYSMPKFPVTVPVPAKALLQYFTEHWGSEGVVDGNFCLHSQILGMSPMLRNYIEVLNLDTKSCLCCTVSGRVSASFEVAVVV